MEIRRLEAFVALVEQQGFMQAANELRISQSALSQQILKLEKELNTVLVDRGTRPARVTPFGWELYYAARKSLEAFAVVDQLSTPDVRSRFAKLRVGVVPAMMFARPASVIRQFIKDPDNPEILLQAVATSRLIEELERGVKDVAILLTAPDDDEIESVQLFEEEYLLCLPDDHPLTQKESLEFADLRNESILQSPRAVNIHGYDSTIAACVESGFSPKSSEAVGSYLDQAAFVSAGMGVTFVPVSLTKLRPEGVEYRSIKNPKVTMKVYASWRKTADSWLSEKFVNYLVDACKDA